MQGVKQVNRQKRKRRKLYDTTSGHPNQRVSDSSSQCSCWNSCWSSDEFL